MAPGHRTCVVCGIKERHKGEGSLLFARFPLDEKRCKEWLRAVGNQELVLVPIEKLHQLRCVCGDHFATRDINKKGNRLKRHAVPKLNLPSMPLTDDQLMDFPLHVASHSKTETKSESENTIPENSQSYQQQNIEEKAVKRKNEYETESECSKKILLHTSETISIPVTAGSTNWQTHNIVEQQMHAPNRNILVDSSNIPTNRTSVIIATTSWQEQKIPVEQMQRDNSLAVSSSKPCESKEKVQRKRTTDENLEFTEREKKLMDELKRTKCTLRSLKKSAKIVENLDSEILKEFVLAAFKNQRRKPQGRRWTPKNKISALAIFKRSPRTYRHMAHTMPLPSVKTLQNLLKKIPMNTGINQSVLAHLTKISQRRKKNDKLCGLLFDEIALKGRLNFDPAADKVEGFEDFGSGERTKYLADHALVFMLQGVRSKFKMPLAYYFVKGTISSQKLATLIKEIITAVELTGFSIISTVCDQGPTNLGALNILKSDSSASERNHFMCNNRKIFIIYDVPHLFKSLRNNFLNNGELIMSDRKAKWCHLVKMEELNRNFLFLHKISKTCVSPKYRAKMKVKYAAQLLSTQASAVLKLMAKSETDPNIKTEIMETALIVHELDKLFDYTNGPSGPKDVKKGLRENVSLRTDHEQVWTEFRKKLETMKFININGEEAKNIKCVQGYICTLQTLQELWQKLKSEGMKYLNLRQLNQDALENLFGVIRQHSPTNRNPTCSNFVAALKTSIVSRLTAPHSRGSNCENDVQELLTDFHDLLFEDSKENTSIKQPHITEDTVETVTYFDWAPVLSIPDEAEFYEIETNLSDVDQQPVVYVSGYIAANILKGRNCSECKRYLKIDDPNDDSIYSYISLREWWKNEKSLTYPTIELCRLIEQAVKVFELDIVPCLHHLNICKLTITMFYAKCDSSFFKCNEHCKFMIDLMYYRLSCLLIRRQCQRVNQSMSIKEESLADAYKRAQQHGAAK